MDVQFNICLEHVLPELLLCCFLLSKGVQDQLTEVREVDEAVPCNPVLSSTVPVFYP